MQPPTIEGFVLRRVLGYGGMGAVFLGIDVQHHRRVAVKIPAGNPPTIDARVRFACEVVAASRVRHPHVVRLRSSGDAGGVPYAVFDYVSGSPIDRLITPLPWPIAAHLSWQLASAVHAVHSAGYLHRDLKPGNVMVSRHGWVTLLDFGLAKPIAAPEIDSIDLNLTAPGTCVGTPRFLAPEVAAGGPTTLRSDLYSLGLVIGQLLGTSLVAEQFVPPALRAMVERLCAPKPQDRPSSAAEVVATFAAVERPRVPMSIRAVTEGSNEPTVRMSA